jgi:hypothetical protein
VKLAELERQLTMAMAAPPEAVSPPPRAGGELGLSPVGLGLGRMVAPYYHS